MDPSLWERLESESAFPLCVMLSLTERCPLSCGHCYLAGAAAGEELSLPEIERLLDELVELGVFRLSLTGGEPGLRPDLHEIVAAAWRRRFLIQLKTSAVLFDRDDIARLRDNGIAALQVSLYDVVPGAHDRFVGMPGAWQRAVGALDAFSRLGGISIAATVLMDWNAGAMVGLVDLARERRWTLTVDPKVHGENDGGSRAAARRASGEQLMAAMAAVPGGLRCEPEPAPGQRVCNAGVDSLYVTSSGAIWLCPVLPVAIGDVRDARLGDIWRESEFRREVAALTWSDSETCMGCERNRFCERCPGEAYVEHGACSQPATVDCELARARAAIWASGRREI